jgi:hypothetical protein
MWLTATHVLKAAYSVASHSNDTVQLIAHIILKLAMERDSAGLVDRCTAMYDTLYRLEELEG